MRLASAQGMDSGFVLDFVHNPQVENLFIQKYLFFCQFPQKSYCLVCPEDRPEFNTACLESQEGLSCPYGEQECCGEKFPEVTMECQSNQWIGYIIDTVCMLGRRSVHLYFVFTTTIFQEESVQPQYQVVFVRNKILKLYDNVLIRTVLCIQPSFPVFQPAPVR